MYEPLTVIVATHVPTRKVMDLPSPLSGVFLVYSMSQGSTGYIGVDRTFEEIMHIIIDLVVNTHHPAAAI